EYNIHMQIFRYMVYIWERYERQMEMKAPGCTKRKDFCYPPILPIVYYEGKEKWTAPKEFRNKIVFGEAFREFLPNFSYYMVPVHDYSNETLIEHGDEISLVMLINKLQTIEDVEQFRNLPAEKVDRILKDTPDYLLDIIANVLRAFLRKENVPEDETEALVGKVKEKKMGELFANMDKMDIQAERRKTVKAQKEAKEAEKRAEEAQKRAEEAQRKADEESKRAYETGIKGIVRSCKKLNASKEFAVTQILEMYAGSRDEVEKLVDDYWNA
ncbi:MAG: Rpn family recombination-promoting nuclease/putative transposase, partial [Suilimivivens sp.]